MSNFLNELYFLISDHLPEYEYDDTIERKLRNTMTPEQIDLFDSYRESEFDREEADRKALFRFLLHVP